jgi:hypothetical protein
MAKSSFGSRSIVRDDTVIFIGRVGSCGRIKLTGDDEKEASFKTGLKPTAVGFDACRDPMSPFAPAKGRPFAERKATML